jgi:U6 snRNA-associated Sm-like protein LSm3
MVLGDVEETVTSVEIDEETQEELIKVRGLCFPSDYLHFSCLQTSRRNIEMLFVRGDVVILVSPPLRTS